MENMAKFLNMSLEDFVRHYVRKIGERYSLKELRPRFDCVFLEEKRCRIYPVRPKQCRTFPFWPENLRSEQSWKEAGMHCEGIREDAPLLCPIPPSES